MKHNFLTLMIFVLFVLGLAACSVEPSNNGEKVNKQNGTTGVNSG